MMERRDFLRSLAGIAATSALPNIPAGAVVNVANPYRLPVGEWFHIRVSIDLSNSEDVRLFTAVGDGDVVEVPEPGLRNVRQVSDHAGAVWFDGSNDYLTRGADLTGNADSKTKASN